MIVRTDGTNVKRMMKMNTMLPKVSLKRNPRKNKKTEEPITRQDKTIAKVINVLRPFIRRNSAVFMTKVKTIEGSNANLGC